MRAPRQAQTPSGAACGLKRFGRPDMSLLTELRNLGGTHYYNHGAPNGAASGATCQQNPGTRVGPPHTMSRTAHFLISVVLGVACFFCGVAGFMVYVASAESPSGSSGGGVIVFGLLTLAAGYGALGGLARAFKTPQRQATPSAPTPAIPCRTIAARATAVDKLAH